MVTCPIKFSCQSIPIPFLKINKQKKPLLLLLCKSFSMASPQFLQLLAEASLFHILTTILTPSSMTSTEKDKWFPLVYSCGYVNKNRRLNPRTSFLNVFHRSEANCSAGVTSGSGHFFQKENSLCSEPQ